MSDATDEFVDLERTIDAPRAAVWSAFVDPDVFAQWYPAPGWVIDPDVLAIDAKVGGLAKYAMHRDGDPLTATSVTSRFTDVVVGERLVSNQTVFGVNATQGAELTLTITLADANGGTHITVHAGPLPYGVDELARDGWSGALDRLFALLEAG